MDRRADSVSHHHLKKRGVGVSPPEMRRHLGAHSHHFKRSNKRSTPPPRKTLGCATRRKSMGGRPRKKRGSFRTRQSDSDVRESDLAYPHPSTGLADTQSGRQTSWNRCTSTSKQMSSVIDHGVGASIPSPAQRSNRERRHASKKSHPVPRGLLDPCQASAGQRQPRPVNKMLAVW